MEDLYVDFSEFDQEEVKEIDSLYERNNKKIMFDDKTMQYYLTMRFRKMDPIYLIDMDDEKCFKFYNQWNPYTGERLEIDPYGPLCFHPDSLIRYFYSNRLNGLWVCESQQDDINYEGYYDIAVGAGFDMYIQSRGYNPEKYLFRLPIIDCYWIPEMKNEATVTMGPILTDEEVKKIDECAKYYGSSYFSQYGAQRPSLSLMKQLYDTAVNKYPNVIITPDMTIQNINDLYSKTNRHAVDKLRIMKG